MAKKGSGTEGITLTTEVAGFSCGYGLIDFISGVPGMLFPKATIIELYGNKSSSKTTLVLETIAFNQLINKNFRVLYADFEKMIRNQGKYLVQLGVDISDPSKFAIIQPETMEDGVKSIEDAVRNDHFDMIVVDTVAAMRPKVELEKGFAENKQMGVRAKLMSEFLRNLMADMPEDGPAVVFINQQYKDINNSSFIQTYETPSSDALKFYAGIRIEVRESTKLKDKHINPYTLEETEIPYGSIIVAKTSKNKVGRPYLDTKYVITYGEGINIIPSLVNAAIKAGHIWNKGNSKSSFVFLNAKEQETSVVGMSRLISHFSSNIDDAVAVGGRINDLWAKDLKFLKDRLARKKAPDSFDDMYEVSEDSEEEGEGLSLEDSTEDKISLNSDEVASEEAPQMDLKAAFSSAPAPVKKVEAPKKPEGLKLKI